MPTRPRIGATIGIDAFGSYDHDAAFFHCRTDLVKTFRVLYPEEFAFHGRRAIVLPVGAGLPADALRHCLSPALTYHLQPGRHLQPERGQRRLAPSG